MLVGGRDDGVRMGGEKLSISSTGKNMALSRVPLQGISKDPRADLATIRSL